MPAPNPPPDLKHCDRCGKVIGTPETKGWQGPECQCGVDLSKADKGPSVGTQR